MAIDVTCASCKTRFQVSEKFAGKKGPCPKCKTIIEVPSKKDEVVIHAPEQSGPKDSTGKAVLAPIFREETKLSVPLIIGIVASVVVVLLMALVMRFQPLPTKEFMALLGSVLLAPPLAFAGYTFLRDQEAAPHRGMELLYRLIAPSVVYPLLWGMYSYIFIQFGYREVAPELLVLIPVVAGMILLGTITAQASLELEFGPAAMHYCLYLASTVILRLIMGMSGYWNITV